MGKSVTEHFVTSAALSLTEQVDRNHHIRALSFYGAVFNALDDYFRKGYAYALPTSDFTCDHAYEDGKFLFILKLKCTNDGSSEDTNEAIKQFLNEIYDIVSMNEMESVKGMVYFNDELGCPEKYILSIRDDHELMQILNQILKPYDFEEGCLPTIRHTGVTSSSPLCFSMFAQYSLQHLKTLYLNLQGRGWEGHGLQLNH